MNVPFLDVRAGYVELQHQLDAAYRRVMQSGQFILGEEVSAFEAEFAAYCGSAHCISVGNGLDALRIALYALGVGPGDDVIVPAHTFVATWLAVRMAGANVIPVDVNPRTRNIDVDAVTRALTSRTRVIVPVHLYGLPVELADLRSVARQRGVRLLEDAAQAHGSRYYGVPVGSMADAAAWSFYPGKNLGAFGDGGAITTNDAEFAASARSFRNYGSSAKYVHDVPGLNSRLDPIQAAFLRVKLTELDRWNARRRTIAEIYLSALEGVPGVVLPSPARHAESSWHLFVIQHSHRDELQSLLADQGIATMIHYPIPPHLSGAFSDLDLPPGAFPVAEELASSVLSLPIGPHLSEDQAMFVANTIVAAATSAQLS